MNMDGKPLTKAQREHHHYLIDHMSRVEFDMHHRIWINERVPRDWARIAEEASPRKKRVTIRVDADVVTFFRKMGTGYGPRMNDVLRAFMHAKLMGLFQGDETLDKFKEQEENGPHRRPEWGDTDRKLARLEEMRKRDRR